MSKPFLIGSHWIRQNQEKRVQRKPLPSDNNAYCEKWWLVWLYYWRFHTQYNCTSIFFFSIYRNMYIEYKVEIQIREKWGRRRKAHSKGPTPFPLKRPQDGAGATKTSRRSWRDGTGATELARRRSLQRRLRHGLITERNRLALWT